MFNNNNYYLIRHWEALSNVQKILSHTIETGDHFPLTQEGVDMVSAEAETASISIDHIFVSPILRTKQTAEICSRYLWWEIQEDVRLIERSDWIFDGKPLEEYLEWYDSNDWDLRIDAPSWWENHNDVKTRLVSLFEELELEYHDKNILLVSHWMPCTIVKSFFEGMDLPSKNHWISFPKAKIVHLNSLEGNLRKQF